MLSTLSHLPSQKDEIIHRADDPPMISLEQNPLPFPAPRIQPAENTTAYCWEPNNNGKGHVLVAREVLMNAEEDIAYLEDKDRFIAISKSGFIRKAEKLVRFDKSNRKSLRQIRLSLPNRNHRKLLKKHPVYTPSHSFVALKYNNKNKCEAIQEASANQFLASFKTQCPHILVAEEALYISSLDAFVSVLPYRRKDFYTVLYRSVVSHGCFVGFPEPLAKHYTKQIVDGLHSLHSRGICHLDLKPENIVVNEKTRQLQIIDYETALRIPYIDAHGKVVGCTRHALHRCKILRQGKKATMQYVAPERYQRAESYDGVKVDVFSVGVILFEMLTGDGFRRPSESDETYVQMTTNLERYLKEQNVFVSKECIDLLSKMLSVDPSKRPTTYDILSHPWNSTRKFA